VSDTLVVEGGRELSGEIAVAGNKNAALPLLAAALLARGRVVLGNVPRIRDTAVMREIVAGLGCRVEELEPTRFALDASGPLATVPDPGRCRALRASIVLAGPLLARAGEATIALPGGDRIGRRPVDTHVAALRALGAEVEAFDDRYEMRAPRGLRGADVFLEEASVLATESLLMAAVTAAGTTVVRNAASEPHVQDLCRLLVAMGARIRGTGTNLLEIEGVGSLGAAEFAVGPDHIETGSFIALAAVTGSALTIRGAGPAADHRATALAFGRLGVRWEHRGGEIVVPKGQELAVQPSLHGAVARIHDAPWPGFPSDLLSIAVVLAAHCRGSVLIHEWMYESRLYWVDKLIAMGARVIVCDPHRAIVEGPARLHGERISSPDIRAGMALLIAALGARGRSVIQNAQQIDRGYERIDARLRAVGAAIERA
jgi:UDP-N-acetylglucosamine 1-carboxyvinyltransferase